MGQVEFLANSLTGRLSEREREVMAYVAAHYRSKAIARLIGTAPKTVDAQIASACRKLGANNRDDAVRMLLEGASIGEKPLAPSHPISDLPRSSPDALLTDGEAHDTSNKQETATVSRRPVANDHLRRSQRSAGTGGGRRTASRDDTVPRLGASGTGALSQRPARRIRDSSFGELPGGRGPASASRWITTEATGLIRLGIALAIATALAVAVPVGLYGAVTLQKLVETLQHR